MPVRLASTQYGQPDQGLPVWVGGIVVGTTVVVVVEPPGSVVVVVPPGDVVVVVEPAGHAATRSP